MSPKPDDRFIGDQEEADSLADYVNLQVDQAAAETVVVATGELYVPPEVA